MVSIKCLAVETWPRATLKWSASIHPLVSHHSRQDRAVSDPRLKPPGEEERGIPTVENVHQIAVERMLVGEHREARDDGAELFAACFLCELDLTGVEGSNSANCSVSRVNGLFEFSCKVSGRRRHTLETGTNCSRKRLATMSMSQRVCPDYTYSESANDAVSSC